MDQLEQRMMRKKSLVFDVAVGEDAELKFESVVPLSRVRRSLKVSFPSSWHVPA
jgi:hypothetical protein